MKPLLISFSGIDGAGKSTQIEMLRNHLAAAGVHVRQLTFWDDVVMFPTIRSGFSRIVLQSDGAVGTPERPAERQDKNAQAWPLLALRAVLYLFDVMKLSRVVNRARANGTGVVIFDRYIYDQLAALPMESRFFRAYARIMLKLAPRPDLSYVLDAIPEDARERKPEYPLEFMHQQRRSYMRLRQFAGLQLIAAADPDEVHHAILERFHKRVLSETLEPEATPATA